MNRDEIHLLMKRPFSPSTCAGCPWYARHPATPHTRLLSSGGRANSPAEPVLDVQPGNMDEVREVPRQ